MDSLSCWSKIFDDKSGNFYFHNEMTNETRWELPPMEIEQSTDKSSLNWITATDTSGKKYYYNELTGESTWNDPFIQSEITPTLYTKSIHSNVMWIRYIDESSGKFYYFNKFSKESTWDYPKFDEEEENQTNTDCWMQCIDKSTNKTYYENVVTKITQWDDPFIEPFNNDNGDGFEFGYFIVYFIYAKM